MQNQVQQYLTVPWGTVHSWDGCGPARSSFVESARLLIGVRFRPQGRNPAIGIDCVGLPILSLLATGIDIPEEWLATDYPATGDPERLRGFLEWFGDESRVTLANEGEGFLDESGAVFIPEAGDIVLFRIKDEDAHCGVMSLPDRVIHAWYPNRRVVEHDLSAEWLPAVVGFFKCKLFLV